MSQTEVTVKICLRQKLVKIETRVMLNNFFFNRTVCEVMWKNVVQPDRLHMTI